MSLKVLSNWPTGPFYQKGGGFAGSCSAFSDLSGGRRTDGCYPRFGRRRYDRSPMLQATLFCLRLSGIFAQGGVSAL